MNVTHLECAACGLEHEARRLLNLCARCGKPLFVKYDLQRAARTLTRASLAGRGADMWRYREVLPIENDEHIVTLGEGWTPLVHARRLGERLGMRELYVKDESQNPTHSFKARGMSAAVSMALALGAQKLAVPSAGNAAGALAAYAARAGLQAHIIVPRDTPRANIIECEQMGAHVQLVDGLITDCAAEIARRKEQEGWFEVSTLKEPYRVEGKKTMGYELAEQFAWELPDAIIYPTGGGTGLIGMWKAFAEMEIMGLIKDQRPRMIVVQAAGCAPIVRAFERGQRHAEEFVGATTVASGLRVPRAIGDFLILDAVRASGGTAVAVTDREMLAAVREIGETEGMFVAPEGAACLPALRKLIERGLIDKHDRVVLFNTGAGVKYLECFTEPFSDQAKV
ncbi:MAG: threonine synthase [Pyrinomonas sp.]|uniref:threonine synthase n=1 Tax=Pyrinomonas sp. TaxID=2080306 RepID=UPI003333D7E4